jgi:tRNA (mo5U34)-methyltransferase
VPIADKFTALVARRRGDARAQGASGLSEEAFTHEPANPPSQEALTALIHSFAWWYHRIYLGRGVYTLDRPTLADEVWHRLKTTLPDHLQNASVLDIGCNAGYFAILLKLRGAGRVLGLEPWEEYFKQAEACLRVWDLDIEYRQTDAHRLDEIQEAFDIVVFTGVLYHLKNPLGVLEEVGRVCRDAVIVETEVIPEDPRNVIYVRQGPRGQVRVTACHKGMMKFIERDELNNDGSNWWVPDTECVLAMLRTAGFEYFSRPVYITPNRLTLIASKQQQSILDLQALK